MDESCITFLPLFLQVFTDDMARPTMVPVNGLYLNTMGQKTGLSHLDAKTANREYCEGKIR